MKKLFRTISIMLIVVFTNGCTGGTTNGNTDTAGETVTTDTMPVVRPESMDSGGTVITPPVQDSNVIMPDSAIKNK